MMRTKQDKSKIQSTTALTTKSILDQKGHTFFFQILYTILTVHTLSIIATLYHEIYGAAIANVVLLLINTMWLWMARKGKSQISRLGCMITLATSLSVLISLYPLTVGLYIFYLPIAIVSFAVFGAEQRKHRFFLASLIIVLSIFVLVFEVDLGVKLPISEDGIRFSYCFNFFSALLFTWVCINFFVKTNMQAEAQLQEQAQILEGKNLQLERINNDLDRLIYSTTHDLRSPLASVKGLIEIAQNETDPQIAQEYFQLINKQLEKLDFFIADMLKLSQTSSEEVVKTEINIPDTINELIGNLRFMDGFENIQIHLDVDVQHLIVADKRKLTAIISNLVSNAVKYHDYAKAVQYIKIKVQYLAGTLQITVADNGLGISDENQKKIFHMFYRASPQSYGSGLGLAIVSYTVQKLNGQISVESTVGKGSTFTVNLPSEKGLR